MRKRSSSRNSYKEKYDKDSKYQRQPKRESGFSSGFSSKPSGFSNFTPQNGEIPMQYQPQNKKFSTAEILEHYKQYNPNQNLTSLNKAERQLYVGNIPLDIKSEPLMNFLNEKLRELGRNSGIFQDGNPIVGCWISGEGHYAFVDFRTPDEATQGFVLQQVQMKGQYLKCGRPKNATGIIPLQSQLLCGDPNFNPNNPSFSLNKKSTSASLVQQALKQSKMIESKKYQDINYNLRLLLSNLPLWHNQNLIFEFCNTFGEVKNVEIITNKQTGQFEGSANIDFTSENEAKKAYNIMIGMKLGDKVLIVKKCQPPTEEELALQYGEVPEEYEIFRQIIDDRPTSCLVLKNVVSLQENHEPEDFKELEFDVQDEMVKYGKVIRTHVPRPPKYGDPFQMKGFGKVYVRYENQEQAEKAKNAIFKRRFNDRFVEVQFYPEDKFINNLFE